MSEQATEHSEKETGAEKDAAAETYKVVVAGQEMEVPLTELLNGYQRQADYTRKTQELSAREKKQEALVEERAMALYLDALKKGDGGKDKPEAKADDDNPLGKEVGALKERLDRQEQQRIAEAADRELETHLKGVLEKYPKADKDKLLVSFYKEAKEGVEVGEFFREKAEALHKAAESYDQKIIDDYVQRRQKTAMGGIETGGGAPRTDKTVKPATTFEEARDRAAARIAAMSGQ